MLHLLARAVLIAAAPAIAVFAVIAAPAAAPEALGSSAFDFTMTTIDGKPMPFAQYKGRVLLVVNTASFCGYTDQYQGLETLYQTYKDKGLTVVGVPSGDFGGQEYAANGEIKQFCESKFGIKFPMSEKNVVTGQKAAPFYRWAATVLGRDKVPKWNFHKYLVGRDGRLIAAFASKQTPMSLDVTAAVEAALARKG